MLGITAFGLFHTAISLMSLGLGLSYLVRRRDIRWNTGLGKAYVAWTAAAAITGLFIFRHGGFNEAHVLSIVTLLTLAAAIVAERGAAPGSWRDCFAALAFSLTVFFHFIPGFNETLVRLPVDAPYITGPDDPKLKTLVGGTFLVFLVIATLQLRRLRRLRRIHAAAPSPA
ncbi:hypothetical protein [Chiayiivirga flava]|uniref:Putative membrane protein n=1 Tax=Chiayiivirga flava TaxID=659595 RepID=A0A7W8D9F3_9GAMM|nr:hypothetical protein [Chiayiivirga flava]MBB5208578.1 putative membrane protein [Chiayiivirga flava]